MRFGWNVFDPLGLEARASYFESKDDEIETTLIPLEAALTLRIPINRHFVPYVGGGAGYYFKDADYDDDTGSWDTSEEVTGTFALAGLNLYLGAVSLFVEAKYNFVETDDDPTTPVDEVDEDTRPRTAPTERGNEDAQI